MNANDENHIDEMVEAYVECALWSSTADGFWDDEANRFVPTLEEDDRFETIPMDRYFDRTDVDLGTGGRMYEDCQAFAVANAEDLSHMTAEQVGHDFWLTRNHHGAGFWDRGLGEKGDRLSKAAYVYGEFYLYVGDDGMVYGQ
jgi:hypothetical protein